MRPYEVMIILDVELEPNDIAQLVGRVSDVVKSGGGTTGQVDHWGRRTFAYEMNHRTEGYYVLTEMAAEPATMAQVDRMLSIDDSVLRHKIMRQPEHVVERARSSGSRRSGARGPGSPGRASGGRPTGGRGPAGPGGGSPSAPSTGPDGGTEPVPALTIEGAQQEAAAGEPSTDQEPATS
jgi:small subunit ribosomal protein S6